MPTKNRRKFLNTTKTSEVNYFFGFVPYIFILIVVYIRFFFFESYRVLVSEDGILETVQFIFYFLTGCLLLNQSKKAFQQFGIHLWTFILLSLAGGFLFLSFEEISWGQRILHFGNPDFFLVYNVQQEVSLHNLSVIQPFLHAGYIVGGLFLGLFIPLLKHIGPSFIKKYLYDWNLSAYFIPLSFIYFILEMYPPISLTGPNIHGFIWRDQEVVEALLAAGLFTWAFFKLPLLRTGK